MAEPTSALSLSSFKTVSASEESFRKANILAGVVRIIGPGLVPLSVLLPPFFDIGLPSFRASAPSEVG